MKADRRHCGYDCNDCGHSKCGGDVIRTKKKIIPIACPGQVKLGPMRMPLLEAAVEHPGSMIALGKVLASLDMSIEPMEKYPGFRFILGKAKGRRR
jgi:hypothetical protein